MGFTFYSCEKSLKFVTKLINLVYSSTSQSYVIDNHTLSIKAISRCCHSKLLQLFGNLG